MRRWYAGIKPPVEEKPKPKSTFVYIGREGYSIERGEEKFYNKIQEKLFREYLISGNINEEKVKYEMQKFSHAYNIVKKKFQHIIRSSGERYFNHQLRIVDYILDNSEKPTLRKILIALNHDTIEDTDISFNGLKEVCSEEEALGVQLISKDPFYNFIDNQDDLDKFEEIRATGILNDKNQPKDNFLFNKKIYPERVTKEQLEAYDAYKELKEDYKEIKNKDYFKHMKNFDAFYNHALELKEKYNLSLSDDKIKDICMDSLEVKYWDRIDNLETAEIYQEWNEKNLEKTKRKIQETKDHIYNIAKETHPYIYEIIEKKVKKAEEFIDKKEIPEARENVKDDSKEIIEKEE